MIRAIVLTLTCVCTLLAQSSVPKEFQNERIMAIVPMVGTGTAKDPIRPMFAPTPDEGISGKSKVLSFTYELSDDGKIALVEFVAKDRDSLKDILVSKVPGVKVFERNKNTKDDVEREFQKVKPSYTFDKKAAR